MLLLLFSFLLKALLIPHTSALYNEVRTITPSFKHFLSFISNSLLLRFQHSPRSMSLHSLCTTSISHPPSAATCYPRYLKQSTSSNGLQFSITYIRPQFPYLEHLITLQLPTYSLNFLSHTLPNSLKSLHNSSTELATSVVSSANNSWFISNLRPLASSTFSQVSQPDSPFPT